MSRETEKRLAAAAASLSLLLVASVICLHSWHRQEVLLQEKRMSDAAWKKHLLHVRERQLEFEKDDASLMKHLHSRDHSVEAMLGGDRFTPTVHVQLPKAKALKPKTDSAWVKKAQQQLTAEKKEMLELAKAQKRREELLKVAVSQLSADKEHVVADVVSGRSADVEQERRRIIGDERLVALLEASFLAGKTNAPQADTSSPAPKIVRGHRHVADVLQDNDKALRQAGVKTNKDFTPWLMGMHEPMTKHNAFFEGRHGGDGEKKLLRAGVAVDRLPGFGEDYRKAIPLPAFHDGLGWDAVTKALSNGHRPLSSGDAKLHAAGVNVNAANALVYGTKQHGTPEADRTTTPFHYADGLEDSVTDALSARKHRPLSFVLHDIKRGSRPLESAGLNVWGSDVLKGLVPTDVSSWENPVPAEEVHHPLIDGEAPTEPAGDEGTH